MIALVAAGGVTIVLALSAIRLFIGPTLYDRALAGVAVGIEAALTCAAFAVAAGKPEWLDVSFALALGFLVVGLASLKFFSARTFQAPLSRAGESG
jgi:multicomponent Na+:H+ antiporter subunit F